MILLVKRVEGVLLMVWKGGGGICFFFFCFSFLFFFFFLFSFFLLLFFYHFLFYCHFFIFLFFLLKILKFLDQIFLTANLARLVVIFWLKAHGISFTQSIYKSFTKSLCSVSSSLFFWFSILSLP